MKIEGSSKPADSTRRLAVSDSVLAIGMGLTGAGTVMLGVLLPFLSQELRLSDGGAGFLFFLQFLGSSLGAILNGRNRARSLTIGYALLTVSACSLALSEFHCWFVIFFFFGLGLGMSMTATSLLISDRYPDDRAARLERLNFAWSAGATAAPVLFLPFLGMATSRLLFFTLQGLFLLLLVWVYFQERAGAPNPISTVEDRRPQRLALDRPLFSLIVLAICAVGVESSLSGWLTTYFHRADLRSVGGAVLTTSLFWLGMTVSRLIFSTRLLELTGRQRVLPATLFGTAAFATLLIATHSPVLIQLGAGLSGMCIGPLYPLLLSFLLERSSRGWIFALGGVGAALFPWLTGLLSAHYGSMRYGLLAPCAGAFLMVTLNYVGFPPSGARVLEPRSNL